MIRNTASQIVGVQMVTAADGTAFTSTTSVVVTKDGGTQTAGGGTVTHEGNGFHSYTLTQAESDAAHVAFTFTGTGAVPQTVQVYPRAATPDVNVSTIAANAITATAIASDAITDAKVAADVTIASVTGSVGSVTGAVGSVTGAVGSVTAGVTLAASAVQAIWDALTSALTTVGSIGKLLVDNVNATISSRSSHSAADVWAAGTRTLTAATNITSTGGTTVPQTGDSFARLGAPAGVSVSADIAVIEAQTDDIGVAGAGLTALATAANLATVDTVVDTILALLDDPRTEPAQGAPPVNPDMATKVDYLYKLLRNKITQDATTLKIFDDAGTTVDHKATVSDDGTTYTRGEIGTGP